MHEMKRTKWLSVLILILALCFSVSSHAGILLVGVEMDCGAILKENGASFSVSVTPNGITMPLTADTPVTIRRWYLILSTNSGELDTIVQAAGTTSELGFFNTLVSQPSVYYHSLGTKEITESDLGPSTIAFVEHYQLKNNSGTALVINPNTTYYYRTFCVHESTVYSSETKSMTSASQLNHVTWEKPYINSSGHFAAWAIYPKPPITITRAGCRISTDLNALLQFRNPNMYSSPYVYAAEDTDIQSYSSTKGGTNFFYRKSYYDTPFSPGTTYYYMFYSWDSNGNYAYSDYSTYTVPQSGTAKLTSVWMSPSADQTLTVGDSLTVTFGADQAAGWWQHIYDASTNQDTCERILTSATSGTATYTFNKAGSFRIYMGASHPEGDMASNVVYVTVREKDTVKPTVAASVGNVTSNGYDVYVTAADNVQLAAVQIGSWHDHMSINDAVWQIQTPDANGYAVFRVRIQDFGYEQDVIYHTNVYAIDAAGNSSDGVRAGDPVIEKEKTYNLSVECAGLSRTTYGYYSQVPAGREIQLSGMDFSLTEEENAELVFDRWSSSLGEDIFVDKYDENTTFIMPESDISVYKYYRHRDPVYSDVTFYAGYGGNLYVYNASADETYIVTEDQPLTAHVCENDTYAVYAEAWDYYTFQAWQSDEFWVQYSNEPGWLWFTMPAHDAYLYAIFGEGPYIVDPSRAFYLPEGLNEIEEEAFYGVDADYFIVPDSVTAIGVHAFPPDAIVYLSISNIPELPLNAISQRGTYIDFEYNPDYEFAAAAVGTEYTVLNIHGKPFEEIWGEWSEWSTNPISADGRTQVETKVEYSYRDTVYETCYTDWSAWSGWTTTRQETSDLKREESTPLYIWYWYECSNCGTNAPTYGTCPSCGGSTAYGDYDIVLLPLTSDGSGTYAAGSRRAYNDPDVGTVWYNKTDNAQYSYTGYRYSTRSTYQQATVGSWSEYSETIPKEITNREIRSRTLYRYRTVQ